MTNTIHIRPATPSDAPFIAWTVATAIADETTLKQYCGKNYMDVLTHIALEPTTQYGYPNALIAINNNKSPVGAIIGYDGAKLHTLRESTFNIIQQFSIHPPTLLDETQAGEFYIDSIAVRPEFQRQGIAHKLINAICHKALLEGHTTVGLIAEPINITALNLYTSIGFQNVGSTLFFNHDMLHLQITLT